MVGVARRLVEPAAEVLEAGRVDPRVVRLERREAHADRRRAEQLGQRGGDRLDPRPLPGEVHVGVDGVAHARQHALLGLELGARHAQGLAEPQPRLDPAAALRGAVVVEDPLDPHPAHVDLRAVGEDRRVFERDAALVVEAIRDPALQLIPRQLPRVHAHMERVEVVVAAALRAQLGDERLARAGGHVGFQVN